MHTWQARRSRGSGAHQRIVRRAGIASAACVVVSVLIAVTSVGAASAQPRTGRSSNESFRISALSVEPGGGLTLAAVTETLDVSPYTQTALMWKWGGSKWVNSPLPSLAKNSYLVKVVVTSDHSAWALGEAGTSPLLLEYNGTSWKSVALPTADQTGYFGALAASSGGAFLGGSVGSSPAVLRYDATWTTEHPSVPSGFTVDEISVVGTKSLWITVARCSSSGCSSKILRPLATGWATMAAPSKMYVNAIATTGSDDVLIAGSETAGTVTHPELDSLTKSLTWAPITVPKTLADGSLQGVVEDAATSAWIVGYQYTGTDYQVLVDRLASGKWTQKPVKVPGKNALDQSLGAGTASDAFVFATSYSGAVCGSTPTTVGYHWNGTKWVGTSMPLSATAVRTAVLPHC